MDTPTPKTQTLWREHVHFANEDEAMEAICDFRWLCEKLERENTALRDAIELERAENMKLKQGATLFDLEMFVTRQAYRMTDALKANAEAQP